MTKPDSCPCCESANIGVDDNLWGDPRVRCFHCGLTMPFVHDAIARWNRRAPVRVSDDARRACLAIAVTYRDEPISTANLVDRILTAALSDQPRTPEDDPEQVAESLAGGEHAPQRLKTVAAKTIRTAMETKD